MQILSIGIRLVLQICCFESIADLKGGAYPPQGRAKAPLTTAAIDA
jgi:hypothetical protein